MASLKKMSLHEKASKVMNIINDSELRNVEREALFNYIQKQVYDEFFAWCLERKNLGLKTSRNSYRERFIAVGNNQFKIKVPRIREDNFNTSILERNLRYTPEIYKVITSLLETGMSQSKIKRLFSSLGISVSERIIFQVTKNFKQQKN